MSLVQPSALRAIIWCAVSTKGQAVDDKDSLPTQEADGRSLCEREGWRVEKTVGRGARIYSLADGMIDENNFRMWIAMGGYRAAGEIDSLIKMRKIGFDARALLHRLIGARRFVVRDGEIVGVADAPMRTKRY